MKKSTLILTALALVSTSSTVFGQNKKTYEIDFTNPESVVNAIFYAAQTKDFAIMQLLCDPYGQGDGDTKKLCAISQIAKQTESHDDSENAKNKLSEFVKIFEQGQVNGQVTNEMFKGVQYAKVPFFFHYPDKESQINETMQLVKRHGNWYLSSF